MKCERLEYAYLVQETDLHLNKGKLKESGERVYLYKYIEEKRRMNKER